MKSRYAIALLLAGVLLTVIAGCYGNSPGVNPTVTFTLPEDSTLPIVPAGSTVQIVGKAVAATTGDSITTYHWTQESSPAGNEGFFTITDGPETIWQAPAWSGPGDLNITLIFTVETLLGGRTEKRLHFLVPAN